MPASPLRQTTIHRGAALRAALLAATLSVGLGACSTVASSPGGSSAGPGSSVSGSLAPRLVSGLPLGEGSARSTASTDVTFTPATVVIGLATVQHDLVSVSSDGSTFTFSNDSGALSQLAPGKVMLLYGVDVAKVTSVSRSGGDLVVQTAPAALTDIIQSGSIKVNGPPDYAGGLGVSLGDSSSLTAASAAAYYEGLAVGQPAVKRPPDRARCG